MLVPCTVTSEIAGCLLVTFKDGRTLFLQSDWDQMAFAHSCGLCGPEESGYAGWSECDPTDITQCPDDYLDIAEAPPEAPRSNTWATAFANYEQQAYRRF